MTKPTETGKLAAGRAVLARRGELGLTRAEVAEKAGVDIKTVWGFESGDRWPIAKTLAAVAAVLGLDAAELMRIADGEPAQAARAAS